MIGARVGDLEGNPVDFLSALAADELAAFRASGRVQRYANGQPIFHEGDDPGGVVALVSGQVRVSVMGVGGRDVVLRFSTPGELVGELAAIAGRPRMATVTAVGPVEAIAMRRVEFQRFISDHPRLAPLVFERLATLLADADRQLVDFATRDVTARIARRLLELVQQGGVHDETGVRITLPLSQDELASWTGASREAVSRSLHLLRGLGWVETGRRELKILTIEGLRSLV
jgi:CRP/FNR family cyclic AMP-dependent transcriptional regulator